jgi:hypothetical protein
MKIKTNNRERSIYEMWEIWHWMTDTFGPPEAHNDNLKRWTYGKDSPDSYEGRVIIDGTWDIEWFDFRDEKDATMFILRWS